MKIKSEDYINQICELQGIPPFTKKMSFYYDETGNCRKFSLKNGEINDPEAIEKDFILGGIAFEDGNFPDVDILFSKLRLQPTQKELKYKHLAGKSESFVEVVGNKRVTTFLNWLIDNKVYIHFSTLNNLYYSLVDFVDSLYETHKQVLPIIEKNLKSALYRFVLQYREYLLPFLSKYDYPNIASDKVTEFSYNFANFIQDNNDDSTEEGFFLETFRQMLKTAGRSGKLIFIQDNESETLIEEYYLFYHERYALFPNSKHIFDEEAEVQKKLESVQTSYRGKELKNFDFAKSTETQYIQISDAFIGLLGHLFFFLDTLDEDRILQINDEKHHSAKENIRKIGLLINRSNELSPLLIKNCNDINLIREREEKIYLLGYK